MTQEEFDIKFKNRIDWKIFNFILDTSTKMEDSGCKVYVGASLFVNLRNIKNIYSYTTNTRNGGYINALLDIDKYSDCEIVYVAKISDYHSQGRNKEFKECILSKNNLEYIGDDKFGRMLFHKK